MPAKGKETKFTPFSRITTAEFSEAIALARGSALQAAITMITGDPFWSGAKRSAFRLTELCALATDPASMTVALTQGSAVVNDGELHNGRWYLIYGEGRTATIPASSHATLDRYDILCVAPKRTATGTVEREIVDGNGNVSLFSDAAYYFDDFDLTVVQGTNGAAAPSASRNDAWQLVPPGLIPIARIRVRGGATTVTNDDIVDLREIFNPRLVPISNNDVPAEVIAKLAHVLPPAAFGQTWILAAGGNVAAIPRMSLFEDQTGGGAPVLKYKDSAGNVRTITVT